MNYCRHSLRNVTLLFSGIVIIATENDCMQAHIRRFRQLHIYFQIQFCSTKQIFEFKLNKSSIMSGSRATVWKIWLSPFFTLDSMEKVLNRSLDDWRHIHTHASTLMMNECVLFSCVPVESHHKCAKSPQSSKPIENIDSWRDLMYPLCLNKWLFWFSIWMTSYAFDASHYIGKHIGYCIQKFNTTFKMTTRSEGVALLLLINV